MITVDGIQWAIPCDITRTAEIKASDISGMLMDRSYFYDVLGTYMQYEISLIPSPQDMGAYYALWEQLSQPVDGHTFTLPYNGSTIEITGRVGSVSDVYVRMPNGGAYWKGVRFTIEPNGPTKEPTLDGVIVRGRSPLPDVVTQQVGDTYTWNGTDWIETPNYDNADNIAY